MVNKILFLDLDGPMIPGRSYNGGIVLAGIHSQFDPIAVNRLNEICEDFDWRIVLHTSWVRHIGGAKTYEHCLQQGIRPGYFHKDAWCDEDENWRYTRIAKWLYSHPEVTDYIIIDDTPYNADVMSGYPHPEDMEEHLMLVSYDDGLLTEHYNRLREG